MSDLKKNFLIRSAGQILGPYSKEEVIDLIKRGKISVFDEVAEPVTFWWYLQDHEDFKKIVNSMDVQTRLTNFLTQISGKISTVSQTRKTNGKTATITVKNTISGEQKVADLKEHEKQSAFEVKVEALDQPKAPPSKAEYISQKDSTEIIRKRISFIIKTSWQVIVVFAICIGAYVLYKEFIRPAQQQRLARENFEANGLNFYKSGNYKQALVYFENANSQNILEDKEKLWLASLFIQEGKLQRATSIVNELSDSPILNTGEGLLLNGLISFSQKDFQSAEKYFNSALTQKEKTALVNLALLKWQSKNYQQSLFYLNQLAQKGYERGIVFYLRALNLLSQNQTDALASYINQELSFDKETSLIKEYRQEFYLMQAYYYMQTQQFEKLEGAVKNLLNEDPFFSEEYQYSSFIATQQLNWSMLYPYCQSIFNSNSENNLFNVLNGFCYLKSGDYMRGARYIRLAKNREPKEPLFLSMYAYLLILQERDDVQIEQALSLIDYNNLKQKLPYIIKARFFERRGDWSRALGMWKILLSFSEDHLSGISGVFVTNYKLGNRPTAIMYKNKGLREYPYYVRLLSYKTN